MEAKLREVKDMMVIGFFAGRDIDSDTRYELREWYKSLSDSFKNGSLNSSEIEEFKEHLFDTFA